MKSFLVDHYFRLIRTDDIGHFQKVAVEFLRHRCWIENRQNCKTKNGWLIAVSHSVSLPECFRASSNALATVSCRISNWQTTTFDWRMISSARRRSSSFKSKFAPRITIMELRPRQQPREVKHKLIPWPTLFIDNDWRNTRGSFLG